MTATTLMTVEEVAVHLKCHPQTVRRWIWSGELGHVKVGGLVRIPEDEVQRMLDDGAQAAERGTQLAGLGALRDAMRVFRARVSREDVAELNDKILGGEQPAEWGSTID